MGHACIRSRNRQVVTISHNHEGRVSFSFVKRARLLSEAVTHNSFSDTHETYATCCFDVAATPVFTVAIGSWGPSVTTMTAFTRIRNRPQQRVGPAQTGTPREWAPAENGHRQKVGPRMQKALSRFSCTFGLLFHVFFFLVCFV